MQSICILYATREGQTRRIAEHVAAELRGRGFAVEVMNVRDHAAHSSLNTCAAAILAASVHAGRHESAMVQFVKEHRGELESRPTAFLSVTLSEAGAERSDATPEEHAQFVADVQKVLDLFFAETGWHPKHVKPVAGALIISHYGKMGGFHLHNCRKFSRFIKTLLRFWYFCLIGPVAGDGAANALLPLSPWSQSPGVKTGALGSVQRGGHGFHCGCAGV